jgi:hypothetical protein
MYRSYLLAGTAILFAAPALAQSQSSQPDETETVTVTAQKLEDARAGIQT